MAELVFHTAGGYVAFTTAPGAPSSLTATANGQSAIILGWVLSTSRPKEKSVKVEYSLDTGVTYNTLVSLAAGSTSYNHTGLSASETVYYRVTAVFNAIQSPYSNIAHATTAGGGSVPGTPFSFIATPVSDTEANLTWQRADDTDTSVLIERAPDVAGSPGAYVQIASLPAHSNVFIDTSLFPSTAYWWRIRCHNASGYSGYATAVTGTTSAATGGGVAPTGLTMTAVDLQTLDFAWTDTNSAGGGRQYLVELSFDGGVTYKSVSFGDSLTAYRYRPQRAGANSIPLVPGTQYFGRVRCWLNSETWGPFSSPANATTTAAIGVPVVPTGLDGGDPTDTVVTLTWDAHPDPAVTFKIERVNSFNPFISPLWNQTYTQIGTASAAATGYTDSTATAASQYLYRIRASNGSGDSPYTAPIVVRTSHAVRGGGAQTKLIDANGTGDFLTIAAAATWIDAMGPGDILQIKGNGTTPYDERLMIPNRRGRVAALITVHGVADSGGNLPILDGTNATTSSVFSVSFTQYETFGVMFVGTHSTNTVPGPGNLVIENLELRNAKNPGTFTGYAGTTQTWDFAASGIYIQKADKVVINNCIIHGNGNGIFTGDRGDLDIYTEDITVQNCTLYNHGNVGRVTEHGLYMQGLRSTVQGCKIGPPLSGAGGNNHKDRGPDTIIRYNRYFNAPSAHLLDLVENQDAFTTYEFLPGMRRAMVYGNSFACDGSETAAIHYGYDHSNPVAGRKGILYFYNNTFVLINDETYNGNGVIVFALGTQLTEARGTVDARNNVLATFPATVGPHRTQLDLLPIYGVGSFTGGNWVDTYWFPCRSDTTFTGKAAGTGTFVTGTDPLLVDKVNDYNLQSGSPARGIAVPLADVLPAGGVAYEYSEPASFTARSAVSDAGAFEF